MYSFIFITHGQLGETLLEIASRIMDTDFSDRTKFLSVEFSMAAELDHLHSDLQKAADEFITKGHQVIILVDLFGGSPSNIAFSLSKNKDIDVISGINLSMVMYSLEHCNDTCSLAEMVEGITRSAKQNITSAKQLLKKRESK